jgi:uncharacterized membrane protein YgcG
MTALIIGAFILIIVILFISNSSRNNDRSTSPRMSVFPTTRVRYDASQLPLGLGLLDSIPLKEAVQRLDVAFTPDFIDRLQYRVMTKHSNMSRDEFLCKLFELKRYFLMNLILKRTPMFSEDVDDIWHEMLMFTREYQNFGEAFMGSQIHHAPERDPKQMPGERAWFDWVYAHLFIFTPYSQTNWNGFFRYPLDAERLNVLQRGNEQEIASLWFDTGTAGRYEEVRQTNQILINQAIDEARHAAGSSSYAQTNWSRNNGTMDLTYLAGAMMFFSIMDNSNYQSNMNDVLPVDDSPLRRDSDGSGCSTTGCGTSGSSDHSGGGDSGGGDSGGGSSCSSGSSCGSGCGSS